jgi:hypothetical protein
MHWSSAQTKQREYFISDKYTGLEWKLIYVSPARFDKHVNLKTTYKLCKIIHQWLVICITDSNASYMQLSLLCVMNLAFVSGSIRTRFIFPCVTKLKLRVRTSTHVGIPRYPVASIGSGCRFGTACK